MKESGKVKYDYATINRLRVAFGTAVAAINFKNEVVKAFGGKHEPTEFETLNILLYREVSRKNPRPLIITSLIEKVEALESKKHT